MICSNDDVIAVLYGSLMLEKLQPDAFEELYFMCERNISHSMVAASDKGFLTAVRKEAS
jgi:hypothetical protein